MITRQQSFAFSISPLNIGHKAELPVQDLFENWNRYYDASTGRYLEPEPMVREPRYFREMAKKGVSVPAYSYALSNPVNYFDPNGLEVQICSRIADLPGNGFFGVRHVWIRTGSTVAGLGPAGGGIPGHGGADSPYVSQTSINDHSAEREGTCESAPSDTDEECVNRLLVIGQSMGAWSAYNNCQTFVHNVLVACSFSTALQSSGLGSL